jgi:hypothetical protein
VVSRFSSMAALRDSILLRCLLLTTMRCCVCTPAAAARCAPTPWPARKVCIDLNYMRLCTRVMADR